VYTTGVPYSIQLMEKDIFLAETISRAKVCGLALVNDCLLRSVNLPVRVRGCYCTQIHSGLQLKIW